MKKLSLYFLILFALLSLSSCGDDDDDDLTPQNYEKIVGAWTLDDVNFSVKTNNSALTEELEYMLKELVAEMVPHKEDISITFREDKTFTEVSPSEGTATGKYTISKNRLTFKYDGFNEGNLTWDISFTGNNTFTATYEMKDMLIKALKEEGVSLNGIKIERYALVLKYKK